MNYLNLTSIVLVTNLLLSTAIMANNSHGNGTPQQGSAISEINVDTSITLTDIEETNLAFMREEEKLARDVYLHLFEKWGTKIFNNISRAEQAHMDSVKIILDAYKLADPAPVDQGFFTDPNLQELYDQLTTRGNTSLVEALKVGALIEEVDINDLYKSINETTNPAIIQVYTQLLNGSYKHLNAFTGQLNSQGISYEGQVLSSDEVDSILSGESFNADIVNGLAVDIEINTLQTQTRFSHNVSSESGASGNNIEILENDPVKLSSHFIPEEKDIGQTVELLAIVLYHATTGSFSMIARSGEQWVVWDGNPVTLKSAGPQTLKNIQNFEIFQGQLNNLPGKFEAYVGYRMDDGKIVFSAEPISFNVK